MLHITCNGEPKERTLGYVKQALDHGLTNILALRGDDVEPTPGQPLPPNGQQQEQQQYFAIDLVRWTRQLQQGRQLSVAVAGHPVGHPKAASYQQHLDHLKAKVDAGGDFIITQFFFEAQAFEQFQLDCRHVGIMVPILPGILLYRNAASVIRIAKLSGIAIPPAILRVLEANRKHREVVENFALHSAYQLCHHLLSKGIVPGVHIYTMNQRLTTGLLLRRLGLWATVNPAEHRLLAYPTFGYCPLAWTRLAQLLLALAQQQQQQKQQRKNTLANGKRNGKVEAGEEEANAVKAAASIILASQPPPFFVPINNGGGKLPSLLVNGGINGITANGVGMGIGMGGGGGAVSIAKWLQQQQLVMTAAEGHHHAWHIRCAVGLASAAIFS